MLKALKGMKLTPTQKGNCDKRNQFHGSQHALL